MENKKLKLVEIPVKSFITKLSDESKNTINGASAILESVSILYHTLEAAESVVRILSAIAKSNQGTDCTGATRLNCNATGTTSPCYTTC
jgi:hypothetical protein